MESNGSMGLPAASRKILVEVSEPVCQAVSQHMWRACALPVKPFFVRHGFVKDREMVREHPALRNAEVGKDRNRNPTELQTQTSSTDLFTGMTGHSRGESRTPPSSGRRSGATVLPPPLQALPRNTGSPQYWVEIKRA